jgi:hypothetical protein
MRKFFASFGTWMRARLSARFATVSECHKGVRSFRPRLERLEELVLPASYVWTGGAPGNNNMSAVGNWANANGGAVLPIVAADDLTFPGGPVGAPGVNKDAIADAGLPATSPASASCPHTAETSASPAT